MNMNIREKTVFFSSENLVFWAEAGSYPRIERAGMDGSQRVAIVTKNLFYPTSITLEYAARRIYFLDAKHRYFEYCNYDGSGRQKVNYVSAYGLT